MSTPSWNGASVLGTGTKAVYRSAAWVGHWLAPRGASRRGALERWRCWAAARGPGPLAWIHAASVGEALAALPVCRRIRSASPVAIALTFTSGSVERWPGAWPVDRGDYLPPDLPGPMRAMLDVLRPRLVAFSRADIWPELAGAAMERGVPVAIIGATVGPRSRRLNWPVRSWFRPLHAAMAYVGAASDSDAARLARLGVRPDVLDMTGDPRHDQVLERVPDGKVLRELSDWVTDAEVLVAGSTEPLDEPLLLSAFALVRHRRPGARLLLCPHDPGPRRTSRLVAHARRCGLEAEAWRGGSPSAGAPCLIVERSGVLADLYALGALAYVGGGFGSRGVHAVIEPASYGIPVIIGPRGHGADAVTLLRSGGAAVLPRHDAAVALGARWEAWLADRAARVGAGLAARGALVAGAAQRTATRLLALMHDP